jgi:hypothetical protein
MSFSGSVPGIVQSAEAVDPVSESKSDGANSQANLYANLPPRAMTWAAKLRLFRFNPGDALALKSIPPGLYSYIQQKEAPYTISLMFTNSYKSLHPAQTQYLGLQPTKKSLLSGGEIIMGAYGQLAAWSFRTGYLADTLGLIKPALDSQLFKDVRLPTDLFYDATFWTDFQDVHHYFQEFFDVNGRMIIINQVLKFAHDKAAENTRIQELRAARNAREAADMTHFSGETLRLYQTLKEHRDLYERIAPRPPKNPRASIPRNASTGHMEDDDAKQKVLREAPLATRCETGPAAIRSLEIPFDIVNVSANSLPGMPDIAATPPGGASLEGSATRNLLLANGDKESFASNKDIGDVSSSEATTTFKTLDLLKALHANESIVSNGDVILGYLISTRANQEFDVARELPQQNASKKVPDSFGVSQPQVLSKIFISRAAMGQLTVDRPVVIQEAVREEAGDSSNTGCCFSFKSFFRKS